MTGVVRRWASARPYPAKPLGTCPRCRSQWTIRLDGRLPRHGGGLSKWCLGSGALPVEGVLMCCIWCGRLFLAEDEAHRFCSETCVVTWTEQDGSWSGWEDELAQWIADRRRLGEP